MDALSGSECELGSVHAGCRHGDRSLQWRNEKIGQEMTEDIDGGLWYLAEHGIMRAPGVPRQTHFPVDSSMYRLRGRPGMQAPSHEVVHERMMV
jgi:hypothetical protein